MVSPGAYRASLFRRPYKYWCNHGVSKTMYSIYTSWKDINIWLAIAMYYNHIETGDRLGSSWFSISRDRLENILSLCHTYCYPRSPWAREDLAVVYCQTSFPKITRFRDFFNWSFVYSGCNLKKAPTSLHWELGENEPMRLVVRQNAQVPGQICREPTRQPSEPWNLYCERCIIHENFTQCLAAGSSGS